MRYYFQAFSIFALQPLRHFPLGANNHIYYSFKIAKLITLIMQNNSVIYALLFPSIFYFCAATLRILPSWSEQIYSLLSRLRLQN